MTFWERLEEAKKKAREEDSRPGLNADNRPTRNLSNELQQTATQTRPTIVLPTAAQTIQNGALNNMNTILSSSKRNAPNTRTIDDLRVEMEEARQIANEMSRMESDGMRDFQALQTPGSERYKQYKNASEARRAYQNLKAEYESAQRANYDRNQAQNASNLEGVRGNSDFRSVVDNALSETWRPGNIFTGNADARNVARDIQLLARQAEGRETDEVGDTAKNMTQEQRDTLMYYAGTNQWDMASEYLESIQREVNAKTAQAEMETAREYSQQHPILGAVGNAAAGLLTPFSYLANAGNVIKNQITGEYTPTDINSNLFQGARLNQATQEGVTTAARDMPILGDIEIGGRNLGSELAGVGLSLGQVLSRAPFGPAGALALAGGSAAGQQTYDTLASGGTEGQALAMSTAVGLIEAATEKIGIDRLFEVFGRTGRQGLRQVVRDVAIQAGIEGTEEAISEVANTIADNFIMGENSQYNQTVNQLMSQGVSREDARREAMNQVLQNVGWSAFGGALSGGLMGGGASAINTIRNRVTLPTAGQNGVLPTANQTTVDTTQPTVEATRPTVDTTQTTNENTAPPAANTGETVGVVQSLRRSVPELSENQPVYSVSMQSVQSAAGNTMMEKARSLFDKIRGVVTRQGFGDVEINTRSVKDDLSHGIGAAKAAVIPSIPSVIQNGTQIDYQQNWKGRPYDGYVFAAPVTMDGNTVYVAAVVKQTSKNRFYLHEVVDSNGNVIKIDSRDGANQTSLATEGDAGTQSPLSSDNSIPQNIQNVNTNNGIMGRPVSDESTVGAAESGFDPYSHMLNEYGAIPEGENPARVIDVPVSTDGNDRVSRAARTVMEAEATPDNMLGEIADAIAKGDLSHDVLGDEKAMTRARNTVEREGFTNALTKFKTNVSKGIVSKDNVALGQVLLNNAMNAGDSKTAIDILTDYAAMATSAGQALQAQRIFKKLSPEGQLYGIQRTASHIQEEIQKRFKDREITIDPELEAEFLAQTDQEGRDKVMEKIYQNVADQIPSNWRDKWNAWRYMAMLVNPRTHIRNVAGNLLFQPVRMVKDKVAATMETFVHAVNPNFEKTKSFVANPSLYRAAWADFKNVKDILSGNKYDDIRSEINSRRTVFKKEWLVRLIERATGHTFNRGYKETTRVGNSWLLEAEDVIFKRLTYADALSGYLQSRGVTGEQLRSGNVDSNLLSAARDYAGQEALKATYQDKNQFSDLLSRRFQENNTAGKVANAAIDAVLPFRRTPANILVRGFEYSPLGLAKSLTADLVQVKRGNMSGAQAIDNIAAGLTGSGLFALGAYLLAQGIVTSGGDENEEQNDLNDLTGKQNYALNLPGGGSVTLDWLAPESLPFFMGVEFMDALGEGGSVMETITSALTSISEPMLELSMLQSLNDLIDSVSFAESSGKLVSMAGSALISYLTQAIPTLGGQIERTTEENRMSSFTDRNNPLPRDIQYALSRASARLLGDYQQVPYIDAWGRTESNGNPLTRALNNFLNPAYTSQTNETAADREIQRLLDAGMTGVVPDRTTQSQKVDGAYLSPEQYVEYATIKGQTSYDVVSEMIESELYQDMTDEEKADAIKRAYQYAGHVAAQAINPEHESESYVEGAQNAQDDFGLSEAEYLLMDRVYGKSGLERIKETMDSGVSMDTAIEVNNALDALKPKSGEDSVSNLQRYRAVVDNVSSVNQQLSVLKTVSTDSDYRKFVVGNNFGVSPSSYVTAREAMSRFDQPNSSGNLGTYTQAEIEAMLDSFPSSATLTGSGTMTLTNSQKAVLWQLISGSSSPKNNPYSYSIGQQVIDAVNEAKQSDNQGTTQTSQYSGLLNFLPGG